MGQHYMTSTVECNAYLSKWQCIHRFHWHNLGAKGCPLCNALARYIKTIGIDNIVQICTNNVSSMRSATILLIHHFPSLYFQGCVANCLVLLLEDWEKTTWAKRIVKKAKFVVSFIWQHHVPNLWGLKIFNRCKIGDQNLFLVTNCNKGSSSVTKDFLVSVLTNMTNVSKRTLTWHPMQNGCVTLVSTTSPLLCIVIENIFTRHNIGDWILNFLGIELGNWKFSIINLQSP